MSQHLNRFFQIEADDLIAKIGSALDRQSPEPLDGETQRELRRWAHTLKGAAQVVRREDVARAAHELETALDGLVDPATHNTALQASAEKATSIRRMLVVPETPATPGDARATQQSDNSSPIETLRVELGQLDRVLQTINESAILASALRRATRPLARARELAAMIRKESSSDGPRSMLHVQTLADELEDLLGAARRETEASLDLVYQELEDLRSLAERLRLVRGETLVRVLEGTLQVAVADAGRAVRLEAGGGELEFDAHLLIGIRDALIQLVRNAVAHGIESPEERIAHGKPAAGTLRLQFRHQGTRNVIVIEDDGRGIDFDDLRRIAVERGWMTAAQARQASSEQLTGLLLRPGVTTSASAGMLSGRGVGLDLVNRTVARLRGDLRISSSPGQGTTFELSIPASLNRMPILVVTAAGRQYGMPRDSVVRTVSVRKLERLGRKYVIDDRAVPFVSLAALMELDSPPAEVAALIASGTEPFLLGVDAMLGIRQLVLHNLPDFLELQPFMVGAAVDVEGNLLPILNPALLESKVNQHFATPAEAASAGPEPLPILVIDDSLTTRMLEQSIFEMEGYKVELAQSAEEALTMALERPFGLFLVDVEMPGMDGVAFVEQTRRDPALREVPAILVTSKGSPEDRARGLKAGARDYVVKSEFDQRHLIRRVRELLRVVQ